MYAGILKRTLTIPTIHGLWMFGGCAGNIIWKFTEKKEG